MVPCASGSVCPNLDLQILAVRPTTSLKNVILHMPVSRHVTIRHHKNPVTQYVRTKSMQRLQSLSEPSVSASSQTRSADPVRERKGLRDSSSHNTRQVLIASRLLKVNVVLTFQSLDLIAFCETRAVSACNRGHLLSSRLHAELTSPEQRPFSRERQCFCSRT